MLNSRVKCVKKINVKNAVTFSYGYFLGKKVFFNNREEDPANFFHRAARSSTRAEKKMIKESRKEYNENRTSFFYKEFQEAGIVYYFLIILFETICGTIWILYGTIMDTTWNYNGYYMHYLLGIVPPKSRYAEIQPFLNQPARKEHPSPHIR